MLSNSADAVRILAPDAAKGEKCLELNVKLLRVAGLWPWRDTSHNLLTLANYYFPRVASVSALVLMSFQAVDVFYGEGKITHLTENIYLSIILVMTTVKVGTLLFRMDDVVKLVHVLESLCAAIDDDEQRAIHEEHQKQSNYLTKCFVSLCVGTGVNYAIGPLTRHESKPMPHRQYFPFDNTHSPGYELGYIWTASQAFVDGILIGTCDTIFASLLINAIEQYRLLNHKLENIRKYALKTMDEEDEGNERRWDEENEDFYKRHLSNLRLLRPLDKNLHPQYKEMNFQFTNTIDGERIGVKKRNRLNSAGKPIQRLLGNRSGLLTNGKVTETGKENEFSSRKILATAKETRAENQISYEMDLRAADFVEHHQTLIRFVGELESIFGAVLVYQIMASLALFCMVAFQTSKSAHIDAKLVGLLQVMFSAIIELFIYCWFASTLAHESLRINEAIYSCDWLNTSPAFKRSIQIILLRSNRPAQIVAANYLPVSLDLFRSIIKTSYSFYTLLTQLDTSASHHEHHH